jgi:osmotically-inducible protein OsmY
MIIRERFLAEMSKQPWAPTSTIDVVVRDGVIELWGTIDDERQRAALRVAAENISAVKEVKDHLVWAAMMIQSDKEDAPLP